MQSALIQLALVVLMVIGILAPRFGTPKAVGSRVRRSSAEYVTSLASLYRGAHATGPALEVIYRQFLRDVCARLALPPDVSLEELADVAARRGHVNAVQLKRLLGRCEYNLDRMQSAATDQRGMLVDRHSLSETELLDLVKHMDRFRKELGID